MDDDGPDCPDGDTAFLGPPGPDGSRPVLRHREDHTVEAGTVRPVKDGVPITGEMVRLSPRGDGRGYKVESLYRADGPPMVNSREYREGWDGIWGKKDLPN